MRNIDFGTLLALTQITFTHVMKCSSSFGLDRLLSRCITSLKIWYWGTHHHKDGATLAILFFVLFCFVKIVLIITWKTNKVKYIKVYIFRKGISQGIYLNCQIFGQELYFWEIARKKNIQGWKNLYFWSKSPKICQNHLNTCTGILFFTLLITYFWTFWLKKPENHFLAKISDFWPKMQKFSKINQKIKKKKIDTYVVGWFWQILGDFLVIFFVNLFFLLFLKKFWPKQPFWLFLKNTILAKNLTI